jgi:glutamine cyclotransferase
MELNRRAVSISGLVLAFLVLASSCVAGASPTATLPVEDAGVTALPAPSTTRAAGPPKPLDTSTPGAPSLASPLASPTSQVSLISPIAPPSTASPINPGTPVFTYSVVNVFPHDPDAFTQGLIFEESWLYEGTGLRGESSLRKVDLVSGDVQQMRDLPPAYFGEGITMFGGRIYQLTWQSNVGFVYDKDSFELLGEFHYPTEGWGLTHDDQRLIMSDGTATLHFLDPDTLVELGQVKVHDHDGPVARLNELEFIDGEVFANVWQTDQIAIINPNSGRVTGWLDLTGLLEQDPAASPVDVLNGIAYDDETGRLFVTGKLWPRLFEIRMLMEP